jgi:hypothetical protein
MDEAGVPGWPIEPPTHRSRSFGDLMVLIVASALVWFLIFLCLSAVVVAAMGGSQAAGQYIVGLFQTWFVLALYSLFWLVVAVVDGSVAWALRGAWMWIRIIVVGLLGSFGSLFLIAPFLYPGNEVSGVSIEVILAGSLPGLAFGLFAAVAAGNPSERAFESGMVG